tara:strand:- start:1511 stop:2200 length:690 start_codon:yes stop_codon:yes gene_type:complete
MGTPKETMIFDRAGIREVDHQAIEQLGIPGLQLMEDAAIGCTRLLLEMMPPPIEAQHVVIVCGRGNNGGDGYAMARHLKQRSVRTTILASDPPRTGSDAAHNWQQACQLDITITQDHRILDEATLIVDALLGTGLDRPVTGNSLDLIQSINTAQAPVLAVDLPSGLDTDTGRPLGDAVHASHTASFVGWKKGFLEPPAAEFIGTVHVIDLGIPASLTRALSVEIRSGQL